MKIINKKKLTLFIALAIPFIVLAKQIGVDASGSQFNVHHITGALNFIRTDVNLRVGQWVNGDVVHLYQSGNTSSYQYHSSGTFRKTETRPGSRIRRRESN